MNEKRYRWILYVIVAVIVGTIGIQGYWNYKNYQINKQQLINDVQTSLNHAIEKYYARLAEERTISFAFDGHYSDSLFGRHEMFDSIIRKFDFSTKNIRDLDSLDIKLNANGLLVYAGQEADSFLTAMRSDHISNFPKRRIELNHIGYPPDSVVTGNLERLTSKVVISMTNDTIQLTEVDSIFASEIETKNLQIDYKLELVDVSHDSIHFYSASSDRSHQNLENHLYTISKSPFLTSRNQIVASFTNSTKEILKRGLTGILISTLLILVVISCLFYLLKIIKHQKQLAEVKNDLISNITHEFKTPIATIGVALESIKDFNVIEDKEKTTSYLNMSTTQLNKLNLMVEKLLETATLDSEELHLNKEEINVVDLVQSLVNKHAMATSKDIDFKCDREEILGKIDIFHFENALNNVIDNAIKYGGDHVKVEVSVIQNGFNILVSDDGHDLTPAHKHKIFEKFYRISKGNTHDVKGFGIGLYYTKKIIEKHNGSIDLDLSNSLTTFKIFIPNE